LDRLILSLGASIRLSPIPVALIDPLINLRLDGYNTNVLSWPHQTENRSSFESGNLGKEQQLSFPEQCQWIQGCAASSWQEAVIM
jgi:hypothetical protein